MLIMALKLLPHVSTLFLLSSETWFGTPLAKWPTELLPSPTVWKHEKNLHTNKITFLDYVWGSCDYRASFSHFYNTPLHA
jgi:hypothetical protein